MDIKLKCYRCKTLVEAKDEDLLIIKNISYFRRFACDKCIKEIKSEHESYVCPLCHKKIGGKDWNYHFLNDKLVKLHRNCWMKYDC